MYGLSAEIVKFVWNLQLEVPERMEDLNRKPLK